MTGAPPRAAAPRRVRQALRDLQALAGEGLTLTSPCASTLIQADGDVVTRVSPHAGAAEREAHLAMVAARLRGLARLAAAPDAAATAVRLCVLNAAFLSWDGAGAGQALWTLAAPLLAPIAREGVRRGLIALAKWKLGL